MTGYLSSDIEEIVDRLGGDGKIFHGASVVVSGGCGFLGRYIVETLKRSGAERIIVLDNLVSAGVLGKTFVKDGLGDPVIRHMQENVSSWAARIDGEVTHVIHAAGIASPRYYHMKPLQALDVSVQGTENLLSLAYRKHAHFMFLSSSEVYGNPDASHIPTPETYPGTVGTMNSRSVYSEGKRCGETACWMYHTSFGVPIIIARVFNTYGPGLEEQDGRVMPNFAARLKAGKPLQVYAPGTQTRTFAYVTDTITGCLQALAWGKAGAAYNIGSPASEITILELADLMGQIAARKPVIEVIPHPNDYPGEEPQRRCPSIEKAREDFGFNPVVSLEEGLRRFLTWSEKEYKGNSVVPS